MKNHHSFDARIRKAHQVVVKAEAAFKAALRQTQAKCKHQFAWELPSGLYGPFGDWEPAHRICCSCGIEEKAQSDFYESASGYRWTWRDDFRIEPEGPYVRLLLTKSVPLTIKEPHVMWGKRP